MNIFGKLLKNVGNVCLIGESGCGKTQLVHDYCAKNDVLLLETSLTADTSRLQLVAKSSSSPGIILQWLETDPLQTRDERGRPYEAIMCYLDGFNYAAPSITALLESLADFRGMLRIPETGKVYFRSDKHLLVISMNPAEKNSYSGTFHGNTALRRRFETIRIRWLAPATEISLLMQRTGVAYGFARALVEFASRTRDAYAKGELSATITTGNLLNYSTLYNDEVDENSIVMLAANLFREDEADRVTDFWHASFKPQSFGRLP
ncbi:MAG: AAA family ATPase [Thermoplasmatota archaeon]|nr:AAA family ATPase [Candidatus Thermoplasmatota archaeon]MBU1915280.1 AAA family ATPase [Candidatus Thermoplasmatota archaeon]